MTTYTELSADQLEELIGQCEEIEEHRAPAQDPAEPLAEIELTGEEFKDVINSLHTLVTECRMHINHDGITVRAVDTANVAMVDMVLPRGYFHYYRVNKPAEIGIDVATLKKSISMFQKKDIVSITIKDLKKTVIKGSGSVLTLQNLDLITIRKDPNPPNIDLKVIGTIPAGQFTTTIKDSAKFSDKLTLTGTNDRIAFMAEGDSDVFNRSVQWTPIKNGIGPEGARSLFSLDCLKDIVGSFNKKEDIRIDMGTDYPIRLTREEINGVPGSKIEFLLAPRIESD